MISLRNDGVIKEEKRGHYKLIQTTKRMKGVVNTSNKSGVFIFIKNIEHEILFQKNLHVFTKRRSG